MSPLISPLVGIWKICYSGEGCSFGWIFRVVFFPLKYSCLHNKKELNTTTYDAPKWRETRNRLVIHLRRQEKKQDVQRWRTWVMPLIHCYRSQAATKSSKKRLTILKCTCKFSAPLSWVVAVFFVQEICLLIKRRLQGGLLNVFDSVAKITSFCFSYYGKWSIFLIRWTTDPQQHKTLYVY